VSVRHPTAAEFEEQAQLEELRGQADRTAAEAARTLAELGARLAAAAQPGAMARHLAAIGRDAAKRALGEVPGGIAGQRGARRATLAAIPALAIAAAVLLAYRRFMAEGTG
jgi:hypothetical protein